MTEGKTSKSCKLQLSLSSGTVAATVVAGIESNLIISLILLNFLYLYCFTIAASHCRCVTLFPHWIGTQHYSVNARIVTSNKKFLLSIDSISKWNRLFAFDFLFMYWQEKIVGCLECTHSQLEHNQPQNRFQTLILFLFAFLHTHTECTAVYCNNIALIANRKTRTVASKCNCFECNDEKYLIAFERFSFSVVLFALAFVFKFNFFNCNRTNRLWGNHKYCPYSKWNNW